MISQGVPRRAITVLAIVACLLTVAGVAQARFTASSPAAALHVGTATMVAPSGVSGSYECRRGFLALTEGITFNLSGFADNGPAGARYRYEVLRGSTPVMTPVLTSSRTQTLASKMSNADWSTSAYTLRITTILGNWTSDPLERRITCTLFGSTTGRL